MLLVFHIVDLELGFNVTPRMASSLLFRKVGLINTAQELHFLVYVNSWNENKY